MSSFIESLTDHTSMLIIARSSHIRNIKELANVTAYFDKLEITNLCRKHSYELTEYFTDSFKLKIPDPTDFKKNVYLISKGNPSAVKEICEYAKNKSYNMGGKINFNLLNLDREIAKIDKATDKGTADIFN